MRVKNESIKLNYNDTKNFFDTRARKYNKENPYSVTMYQDNNKKLVQERNRKEQEKILPLLELDEKSKIIDVACGIGRWADAVNIEINTYCGIDFSSELIEIAKNRNNRKNYNFFCASTIDLMDCIKQNNYGTFNRVIIAGLFIYLNDNEIEQLLNDLVKIVDNKTIMYIREPVGIENRLTLKNFYSKELNVEYNAIYRTRDEYNKYFQDNLGPVGFYVHKEGFLFSDEKALNNRKETAQYFYILYR